MSRPREIMTSFASPTSSTDASSSFRFEAALNSPTASPSVDRFIPRREMGFSRDLSNYIATSVEHEKSRPAENDMSPAKEDYRKALRQTILSRESPKRVLMVSTPETSKRLSTEAAFNNPSPNQADSQNAGGAEPSKRKRPARFIPKSPDKILDAPDLVDDYYLNLLDWSSTNTVAVALGQSVFLWNASTGATHKLVETAGSGNIVTSLAWASNGSSLAIGTHSAEVQLWDVESGIEIRRMRCDVPFANHRQASNQPGHFRISVTMRGVPTRRALALLRARSFLVSDSFAGTGAGATHRGSRASPGRRRASSAAAPVTP